MYQAVEHFRFSSLQFQYVLHFNILHVWGELEYFGRLELPSADVNMRKHPQQSVSF
jgi:hypothetical protein